MTGWRSLHLILPRAATCSSTVHSSSRGCGSRFAFGRTHARDACRLARLHTLSAVGVKSPCSIGGHRLGPLALMRGIALHIAGLPLEIAQHAASERHLYKYMISAASIDVVLGVLVRRILYFLESAAGGHSLAGSARSRKTSHLHVSDRFQRLDYNTPHCVWRRQLPHGMLRRWGRLHPPLGKLPPAPTCRCRTSPCSSTMASWRYP